MEKTINEEKLRAAIGAKKAEVKKAETASLIEEAKKLGIPESEYTTEGNAEKKQEESQKKEEKEEKEKKGDEENKGLTAEDIAAAIVMANKDINNSKQKEDDEDVKISA